MNNQNNGYTMEVPYKLFGTPPVFWNLVRRNLCIGIQKHELKFDTDAALEVSKRLVEKLNVFTSVERFNAEGLKNDAMEPSEDVYKEWAKSLRFFLTVRDAKDGYISFEVGAKENNPWTGVQLSDIDQFGAKFYLNKDGHVAFTPIYEVIGAKQETPEDFKEKVTVNATYAWSNGSLTPGETPTILTMADFIDKCGQQLLNAANTYGFNKAEVDVAMKELEEHTRHFDAWGNGNFVSQASAFVRYVPTIDGGRLHCCFTARGDFEFTHFTTLKN